MHPQYLLKSALGVCQCYLHVNNTFLLVLVRNSRLESFFSIMTLSRKIPPQAYQTLILNPELFFTIPALALIKTVYVCMRLKGVYQDENPLSTIPWTTPLNYIMSRLAYQQEAWRKKDKEGDRQGWVRQQWNMCERNGEMEMRINETQQPSVSTARLLSDMFYILMKREKIKKKSSHPLK